MDFDIQAIFARWVNAVVGFLPTLLMIALILAATLIVSRRTQVLVRRLSARTEAPPEIGELLGRGARIGVLLVGAILVLQQLGWSATVLSFVAGLGIAGIAIGFALQDIAKQFAAGVLLMMLRPFRVGDRVRISGFEGRVVDIQFRATVLRTVDGDEVQIPNADVYTSPIVNLSRYDLRRQTLSLNVPPEIDLARARAALRAAIRAVPGVAADPPPSIVGTSFDGTTTRLELRFWVDQRDSNPDAVITAAIAAARQALAQARTEGGTQQ